MNPGESSEEKTRKIFKNVEAGDLMLYEVQSEVLALFGNTKAGKTTSSHYLCNSTLESVIINNDFHWRQLLDNQFKTALIGMTSDSQTEIPNLMSTQIKVKDQKIPVVIVDMPGYQDNHGFNRIYCNSYFHYRAFSKMKSIKFIITFSQDQFTNKETLQKIILEFTLSFQNFAAEEENILKATMFLVTKVPKTKTLENIVNGFNDIMDNLKNATKAAGDMYKSIAHHMIKNKKIFIIHAPTREGEKTPPNTLLLEMYRAAQFWNRDSNGTTVDMRKIKFSISDLLYARINEPNARYSTFLPDFEHFCSQMTKRFDSFLFLKGSNGSLVNLIKNIVTDAFSQDWAQATFMTTIKNFVKQNSSFLDISSKDLVSKREKAENILFGKKTTTTGLNVSKPPYFILKFEVLESIILIAKRLTKETPNYDRNLVAFQKISQEIRTIFHHLKTLSPHPDDTPIIIRYCYLLQRIIEESIITTKTLYSDKENFIKLQNSIPGLKTEDITPRIQDVLNAISESYTSTNKFIEEFDTTKLNRVTHDCISFFNPERQNKIDFMLQFQQDSLTQRIIRTVKFAEILTKYQTQYIQQAGENQTDINNGKLIVLKILDCRRILCYLYEQKIPSESQSTAKETKQTQSGMVQTKEIIADSILQVTKAGGSILLKLRQYSLAREMYQSIGCVTQVLRAFDSDLAQSNKQGRNDDYLRILKEAGEYASANMQNQRALRYFQEAYDVCKVYKEREKLIQRQIALTSTDSLSKFNQKMKKKKVQFERIDAKAIVAFCDVPENQLSSPEKSPKTKKV